MYNSNQRMSGLLGSRPSGGSGLLPLPQSSMPINSYDAGERDTYDDYYDRGRGSGRRQDDYDDYDRDYDRDLRPQSNMGGSSLRSDVGGMGLRSESGGMGLRSESGGMGLRSESGGMSLLGNGGPPSLLGNAPSSNQQNLLGNVAAQISLVNSLLQKASGVGLSDLQSLANISGGNLGNMGSGGRNMNLGGQSMDVGGRRSSLDMATNSRLDMAGSRGLDMPGRGLDMVSNMDLLGNRSLDMGRSGLMDLERNRRSSFDMNQGGYDNMGSSSRGSRQQVPQKRPQSLLDIDVTPSGGKRSRFSSGNRSSGGLLPSPTSATRREDSGRRSRNGRPQERKSRFSDANTSSNNNRQGRRRSDDQQRRSSGRNDRSGNQRREQTKGRAERPSPSTKDVKRSPAKVEATDTTAKSAEEENKYDPSEPTDDTEVVPEPVEKSYSGVKPENETRARSKTPKRDVTRDMQVTIANKESDGEKKSDKGHSHRAKEVESSPFHCHVCNVECSSQKADAKEKKFYCHVCHLDFNNERNFSNHMQSKKHGDRMNQMFLYQKEQEAQNQARKVAEKHLRQIEGKKKLCRICDREYLGDAISHQRTGEHKRKDRLVSRGCPLCRITMAFESYPGYVKHIAGTEHKKTNKYMDRPRCRVCRKSFKRVKQLLVHYQSPLHLQNKSKIPRGSRKEDDDGVDFPEDLEGLVTIDAIGEFSDEDSQDGKTELDEKDASIVTEEGSSTVIPEEEPEAQPLKDEEQPLKVEEQPLKGNEQPLKVEEQPLKVEQQPLKVEKQPLKDEEQMDIETPEAQEVEELPEYDAQVALGQEHVIPVSGFFCKLCHKFYNSKTAALVTHCQTKAHYEKLKVAFKKKQKKLNQALTRSMPSADDSNAEDTAQTAAHQSNSQITQASDSTKDDDESQGPELQIISVTSLCEWSSNDPAVSDSGKQTDLDTTGTEDETDIPVESSPVVSKPHVNKARRGGKAVRGARK